MPGISFSRNWSHVNTSETTGHIVRPAISLRFYMSDWNGLRFYLTPKYRYGWGHSRLTQEIYESGHASHEHEVAGAWGLQYAVSGNISIFGDIGVGYRRVS